MCLVVPLRLCGAERKTGLGSKTRVRSVGKMADPMGTKRPMEEEAHEERRRRKKIEATRCKRGVEETGGQQPESVKKFKDQGQMGSLLRLHPAHVICHVPGDRGSHHLSADTAC